MTGKNLESAIENARVNLNAAQLLNELKMPYKFVKTRQTVYRIGAKLLENIEEIRDRIKEPEYFPEQVKERIRKTRKYGKKVEIYAKAADYYFRLIKELSLE